MVFLRTPMQSFGLAVLVWLGLCLFMILALVISVGGRDILHLIRITKFKRQIEEHNNDDQSDFPPR